MEVSAEAPSSALNEKIPNLPGISGDWILFFIFWPFGALINALRRFREPGSKTVFWLFCFYFGFVFIYGDPFWREGTDSARYAKDLIDFHTNPISFGTMLSQLYSPKTDLVDVYKPLSTWFLALFTADPRILFAFFAAVFGFFYAQNLWIIFSRINVKVGITLALLMISYALINPVWNINGARMWTAAQVFLYGNLIWFINGKKIGLFWSALSILFHFSFCFPVLLFALYIFLPGNLVLYFLFFFGASIFKEINLHAVSNFLSFLPDVFQPRVEGYTNEDYAKGLFNQQLEMSMHVKLFSILEQWIVYIWIIVSFLFRKKMIFNLPAYRKVFGFALFLGGFAQISSLIPSGGRFIVVANCLFYVVFILFFTNFQNYHRLLLLKIITIPVLTFLIIFNIRRGLDFAGIFTFLGNPILAFFSSEQVPLIEFLKQLL
jgi:hypothetical protein